MAVNEARRHRPLSVEEYLEIEKESAVRHEFVGGDLHAFAGASDAHNRIALRVASRLLAASDNGPCRVYMSDMKLWISHEQVYYPDVFVTCDTEDTDPYVKKNPCLVVEVLSPSTQSSDLREKLTAYRRLDSLRTYVILYQDQKRAVRHWRDEHGAWWNAEVSGEGIVTFPCPEIELTLAEIYDGIDLASS